LCWCRGCAQGTLARAERLQGERPARLDAPVCGAGQNGMSGGRGAWPAGGALRSRHGRPCSPSVRRARRLAWAIARITTSAWWPSSTSMGGVSRGRMTSPSRGRADGWDAAGGGAAPAGHRALTPRDARSAAWAEGPLACARPGASASLSCSTPRACHGALARAAAEGPVAKVVALKSLLTQIGLARAAAEGPVAKDTRVRTIAHQRRETS
jgi:hypothetical protein